MDKNIQFGSVAEVLSTFSNFLMFTLALTLSVFHSSGRLSHWFLAQVALYGVWLVVVVLLFLLGAVA
jgi:hypothetical protein